MDLIGCSNPGFSYTKTYIYGIIDTNDWIKKNKGLKYTYEEMQNEIDRQNLRLKSSALRMLIPFLIKAGIVNKSVFEGSRNNYLDFENFYTKEGKCFIELLYILQDSDFDSHETISNLTKPIFEKFGLLQFISLIKNGDDIYIQLLRYFIIYETIDKEEFFLLTTYRPTRNDILDSEFDDIIKAKRKRQEKDYDYKIVKHVNSFNYIISMLKSMGVVIEKEKRYSLNTEYESVFETIKKELSI